VWILKQATLALPAFGSDTRLSIEELVAGGLNQRDQVIETNTPFNFDDAISDESRRFAKTGSGHTNAYGSLNDLAVCSQAKRTAAIYALAAIGMPGAKCIFSPFFVAPFSDDGARALTKTGAGHKHNES
jgi:hypothetical protein